MNPEAQYDLHMPNPICCAAFDHNGAAVVTGVNVEPLPPKEGKPFPDNFTDGDGNQWVHCVVQTDPTAVEYKRVVEPNTNEVISV